jgi:hypothetical protein
MDLDQETRQFKRLLRVGVLFLVSIFFVWREFKYAVWGEVVDAHVVEVRQLNSGARVVRYDFKDRAGNVVRDSDTVSGDYAIHPGDHGARVQYLPGGEDEPSRIEGHRNVRSLVIFFAALLLLAVFLWPIVREAREHAASKRAGR